MPTLVGVVVEKGSDYVLAHTGPRALDGRPQGGAWGGVIPRGLGAIVNVSPSALLPSW